MSASQLYRLSAAAGMLAAAVLTLNVLRRSGLIASNVLTHGIGPLAPALALLALTGIFLWQNPRAGRFGVVAYAVTFMGFAGAVGLEVAAHVIFVNMPKAQVDQLLAGPARPPFAVIAFLFSLGAVLFGVSMFRAGGLPRPGIVLFSVGLAVFGWRNLLPETLVTVDGLLSAVAIVWLAAVLWAVQDPRPTRSSKLEPGPTRGVLRSR